MEAVRNPVNGLELMERTPEGIQEATYALLEILKEPNPNQTDNLPARFFEETFLIFLHWMMTGELNSIQELLEKLHTVIASRDIPEDSEAYELKNDAETLCRCIAIYLRTNNLAKGFTMLAGEKKIHLRKIIKWIYAKNQRVLASDIVKAGITPCYSQAARALRCLKRLGFLVDAREGRKIYYEMSWYGRSCGKLMQALYPSTE